MHLAFRAPSPRKARRTPVTGRTNQAVFRTLLASSVLALGGALPAFAQQTGLVADFIRDVGEVEQKFVSLARAMPAESFDWRPGDGVRSIGEVYLHVAGNNWFLAGEVGNRAPAESGIVAGDYGSVETYEKRKLSNDQIVAELERSFAFPRQALGATTAERLETKINFFGSP